MALFILQPGCQPLGQFDVLDTDQDNVVGGMIGTWQEASRTNTATETAVGDVLDGYVSDGISEGVLTATRPVIAIADSTGDDNASMYLLDDGKASYGTLFGSVISMFDPTGTAIGPHTSTGSGKVTVWANSGLYAVTFEACYSDRNVTNGALENGQDTPLPGDKLYRHRTTGKITRLANSSAANEIGVYIEHSNSGSLVTTPASLVGATQAWDRVVFNYFGFHHNM